MVLLEISILTRVVIGISAMVLLFASFLVAFISNQRKKLKYHKDIQQIHARQQEELQIQNSLLEDKVNQRTQEITLQSEKLQETLSELKASQLQLVQKEKMASLGELTAGIAHEIQNPLNFVNNFAEINGELLAELSDKIKEELLKGNADMSLDDLIKDLSDNHRKILDHGKRADSIVKNMLQHSRKQVGELELTDINALADEYLKL
ncbi:MAG: two-component sensor histidine kinase, partial [Ferruginibacter sp.]